MKKCLKRLTEEGKWGIMMTRVDTCFVPGSQTERMFIMIVTKQTIIGDILDYDVETAQFFFAIGMHCLGCPSSRGESIEAACAVHGTDADQLVEEINKFLAAKQG